MIGGERLRCFVDESSPAIERQQRLPAIDRSHELRIVPYGNGEDFFRAAGMENPQINRGRRERNARNAGEGRVDPVAARFIEDRPVGVERSENTIETDRLPMPQHGNRRALA